MSSNMYQRFNPATMSGDQVKRLARGLSAFEAASDTDDADDVDDVAPSGGPQADPVGRESFSHAGAAGQGVQDRIGEDGIHPNAEETVDRISAEDDPLNDPGTVRADAEHGNKIPEPGGRTVSEETAESLDLKTEPDINEPDIEAMSVKELQDLLTEMDVDFHPNAKAPNLRGKYREATETGND